MLRTRMTTLAGLVGEGDGGSGWGLGETFVFSSPELCSG